MKALGVAATGMLAQQMNVDVIANNIANLSTTGYKRQRAQFQDLLYQQQNQASGSTAASDGSILPSGVELGFGVKAGSVYRVNEQGGFINTEGSLDIAISGSGFLQVTLPDGTTAFTRDGSLTVNETGQIVTNEGFQVEGVNTIPDTATNISINANGEVEYNEQGTTTPSSAGQFQLARFVNVGGLEAAGGNIFLETEASGTATTGTAGEDGFGTIEQGFLENSNVDSVTEITLLIAAQRNYELNSQVISTSDQMLQTVSQLR